MKVTFISSTQPSPELQAKGIKTAEDLVVYCARVTSPSRQTDTESAPRLIRFLIKRKHWSPFEMADLCLEVETSRAIAAQLLRHRSLSFQEFSQRYAPASLGFEKHEARGKVGESNRQGSADNLSPEVKEWWRSMEDGMQWAAQALYDEALAKGVAPEQARFILPLGVTTRLYVKGSVRSWIHYLALRTDSHAQQEHREMAQAAKAIFDTHFPHIAQALAEGQGTA